LQIAGRGVEATRDVSVVRADTRDGYLAAAAEVRVGTVQHAHNFGEALLCCCTALFAGE
jgi:hypothetical protein